MIIPFLEMHQGCHPDRSATEILSFEEPLARSGGIPTERPFAMLLQGVLPRPAVATARPPKEQIAISEGSDSFLA